MASSSHAAAGTASPTKRRAALAPLDANAMPASPKPFSAKDGIAASVSLKSGKSPPVSPAASWSASAALAVGAAKRTAGEDAGPPPAKKPCLEERDEDAQQHRPSRSQSPDSVSVFDTSAGEGDSSWATASTEPDHAVVTAFVRPRPSLTREQAREKAEILRLRLGLASYKVRTGQVAVPLANLRRLPLPAAGRRTVRVQSPAPPSTTASPAAENNNNNNFNRECDVEEGDDDDDESQSQTLPQSQQSAATHVSASTNSEFDASMTIAATPPRQSQRDAEQEQQEGGGDGERGAENKDKDEAGVEGEGTRNDVGGNAATGLLSLAMASMS
ncbi:hypothetical protein JDV02_000683 [Purpureocillium takamizusanense]|uniref:Cyclin-dependent kinase n=1 Tax=Purpureocillium takamizusanense TaxID=2060973 RepID=A0A9Q8V6N0_9HYPO|nr:uncharacterized protein JDV02_000683 [Purpureocillium takamizusanense]UNI13999.1 hypothetical protein JDV02_000683 [Purpureocillium takamizusanense]